MLRATFVAALVVVLAASAMARPQSIEWRTDLGQARQEAWERGVPMLIFLSRFT
jgi:hypothetical protein